MCSSFATPAPMPNSSLPFDMMSSVAVILASNAGFLKELQSTMVPSLIFVVTADSAERVVQHSKTGCFPKVRWSSSHMESYPNCSHSRTRFLMRSKGGEVPFFSNARAYEGRKTPNFIFFKQFSSLNLWSLSVL